MYVCIYIYKIHYYMAFYIFYIIHRFFFWLGDRPEVRLWRHNKIDAETEIREAG